MAQLNDLLVMGQSTLLGPVNVQTELYENNKRVINCIYTHAGINALNDLKYAFRSGNEQKEITIFNAGR